MVMPMRVRVSVGFMIADQKVCPVAPFFQESTVVLQAQFVALAFGKLAPNTMFMQDNWNGLVCNNLVSLFLEMEAEIDVKVSIEPKTLPHQADVP